MSQSYNFSKNFWQIYGMRLVADIVILFVTFATPWWLGVILGIFATLFFPLYLEVIVFGWILDFIYGGFRFELSALIWLVISFFIRKRVQFLNGSKY
ncbi:MAG: hypothetical protein PHF79_01235 [Candidatus Pacebacteria bacterium]|nr:hypothetical protein [Candidatus Paceibacterota bacterium]